MHRHLDSMTPVTKLAMYREPHLSISCAQPLGRKIDSLSHPRTLDFYFERATLAKISQMRLSVYAFLDFLRCCALQIS